MRTFEDRLVLRRADEAVAHRNDVVRPSREKAVHISIFAHPDRDLRLAAVAPRILHAGGRSQDPVDKLLGKSADADEVTADLAGLERELPLIGERLDLAAAALPRDGAAGLCAEGRGLLHRQKLRVAVALARLHDHDTGGVADDRVLHKQRVPARRAADPLAVAADVVDPDGENVVF